MQDLIKKTDEQFAFLLAILMLESDEPEAFRRRILRYMEIMGGYGLKHHSSEEVVSIETLRTLYVRADELFHQLKFLKESSGYPVK